MKKIPSVFKKRYTEKKYASKIRKKLHIDADREFIDALFSVQTDQKTGKTVRVFDGAKVTDKQAEKRVSKIAKEIKKQKGRFNLVSLFAALLFFGAVVLAFGVFRNQIARMVIVSAAENAFGAKCDLKSVDFDLANARFSLAGLAVANRDSPMTNLFEIGEAELKFDLLWLTRGKLHVDTGKVTHIAWGTPRSVSGALPPKREKAWKERQDSVSDGAEGTNKDAFGGEGSPINLSAGFSAVTDMLDPQKILDAEMAQLLLPSAVDRVSKTVPDLTAKWAEQNKTLKTSSDGVVKTGKTIAAINPASLKTLEDIQAAIKTVEASKTVIDDGVSVAKKSADDVKNDIATVAALKKEAETAYKNDAARLAALASSVKAANLETGTKVLSSVFESFAAATLGNLYPKAEKAIALAVKLQNRPKESQAVSLKKKSGALSRSAGRNVAFGVGKAPTVLFKSLELGIDAPGVSGTGSLTDITDDQEANGKPSLFALSLSRGAMSERLSGSFDLRSRTETAFHADFAGNGYAISIPAPDTPGVPSVRGTLNATGTVRISRSGDASARSMLSLADSRIETKPFDPSWAYSAYQEVLSNLTAMQGELTAELPRSGNPAISFSTDADKILGAAIADGVKSRIAGVRKDVQKLADSWLAEQQAAYAPQIAKFASVTGLTPEMAKNALAYETVVDDKKAALEQRAKDLVNAQTEAARKAADAAAAEAKAAADKAAADAKAKAADSIKKLF